MLDLGLYHELLYDYNDDGNDNDESSDDNDNEDDKDTIPASASDALSYLVSANADTLEGLALDPFGSPANVLEDVAPASSFISSRDSDNDQRQAAEALAAGLFRDVAHESSARVERRLQLLEGTVRGLPRLEQLSVRSPWRLRLAFRVAEQVALLGMARRLAAAAGPRLRYLNVGHLFMRVSHESDDDGEVSPVLEAFSPLEADRIELWRFSLINSHATNPH